MKSLFAKNCEPCPRKSWCAMSPAQQCEIPEDPERARTYWESQESKVSPIGGVHPQALPPLGRQPRLGRIIHVHNDSGVHSLPHWNAQIGVGGKGNLYIVKKGCRLNETYLRSRGLSTRRKVFMPGGKDEWLQRFVKGLDSRFFTSLQSTAVDAVMTPNFSAYGHAEHWVWLDNRAYGQQFMRKLIEHNIPAIFHTYLEDAAIHVEWLVEYLRLNPTQTMIATSFDRGKIKDRKFVYRRIKMLEQIETQVGKPLHLLFNNMLAATSLMKEAATAFPGRVSFSGGSVILISVNGTELTADASGKFGWLKCSPNYERGDELLLANIRCHADVMMNHVFKSEPPKEASAGTDAKRWPATSA